MASPLSPALQGHTVVAAQLLICSVHYHQLLEPQISLSYRQALCSMAASGIPLGLLDLQMRRNTLEHHHHQPRLLPHQIKAKAHLQQQQEQVLMLRSLQLL